MRYVGHDTHMGRCEIDAKCLGDLDVYGKKILQLILKKLAVTVCVRSRQGSVACLIEHGSKFSTSVKTE
jgi:hypothetical protein